VTGQLSGSRAWLAGGVLAAVLIVLASWFLFISPVRADTQTLHDQTDAVEGQNAVLQAKLDELKEQDANRDELIAAVRGSLAALPPEVALPEFNRQILDQASDRGVELVSITVGAPSSATAPAATDPATTPSDGQLTVPITIQTSGPDLAQLYFLRDLQEVGPRRALVTSTAFVAPTDSDASAGGDVVDLTTQLTVFTSSLSATDREQLAEVLGDDLTG
jgi:hypothetical protein